MKFNINQYKIITKSMKIINKNKSTKSIQIHKISKNHQKSITINENKYK